VASLDELRRIVPPPAGAPAAVDWVDARGALGVDLPSDYVALVDEWGAGSFDGFLWVFAPGHQNPNLKLVQQAEEQSWALRETADAGEVHPFEPAIVPGGLLAWGLTDNGDVCYWVLAETEPPRPAFVAVNESRGPEWYRFDGDLTDFLVSFLTGRERVPIFPDDVPSARPGFVRA
jgi:hypothetical protein